MAQKKRKQLGANSDRVIGDREPQPRDTMDLIKQVEGLRATEKEQQQRIEALQDENRRLVHELSAVNERLDEQQAAAKLAPELAATVSLAADLALGAGDRKAGTVLCGIHLAEGVALEEVLTAFRNPARIDVR